MSAAPGKQFLGWSDEHFFSCVFTNSNRIDRLKANLKSELVFKCLLQLGIRACCTFRILTLSWSESLPMCWRLIYISVLRMTDQHVRKARYAHIHPRTMWVQAQRHLFRTPYHLGLGHRCGVHVQAMSLIPKLKTMHTNYTYVAVVCWGTFSTT